MKISCKSVVYKSIVVLATILTSLSGWAADFDVNRSVELRRLTTFDGLSDLLINTIYRDAAGFLYFGTAYGVDRFDGIRIKSYSAPGDNERLKRIKAISHGPNGYIYAGNGEGLFFVDDAAGMLTRIDNKAINFSVNGLDAYGDTLYITTDRGLFIKTDAKSDVRQVVVAAGAFSEKNHMSDVSVSPAGDVWISGYKTLHKYNTSDGTLTTIDAPSFALPDESSKIVTLDDYVYYSANESDLIKYSPKTNSFSKLVDSGSDKITSMHPINEQLMMVGLDGGGVKFIDLTTGNIVKQMLHAQDETSLSSNSIYSVLPDNQGLIWIGYYQGGVDYSLYRGDLFDVYNEPGLIDTKGMAVRALLIDGNRKLIGTREGLFLVDLDRNIVKSYKTPQLRANIIFTIKKYKGKYYVGTFGGGIYVIDPNTLEAKEFHPVDSPGTLTNSSEIFALETDGDGRLWIGSSQGVHCLNDGIVEFYFSSNNSPLPPGNVYEIFFDSTGTGWFCTESGVAVWSGGHLRADGFPSSFNNREKYREVYEDSRNNLYFVPDRGPIIRTNLNLSEVSTLHDSKVSDRFWNNLSPTFIVEDSRRNLWIGSTEGICKHDSVGNFVHYNYVDGIPNQTFTFCKPVIDEDGTIWFGNNSGLLSLESSDLESSSGSAAHVVITDILVNGKSVLTNVKRNRLKLNHSENNVRLLFTDFSYTSPSYMMYEYSMTPLDADPDWQMLRGISEESFYDLKPGNYCFRVRSVGSPSSEASVVIEVGREWGWLINLLLVLLVLIAAAAVFIIYRHTIRRHAEKQQAELADGESQNDAEIRKYRTINISEQDCKKLLRQIDKLMETEKLYANPDLKIKELAERVGSSSHSLSYLFNVYLQSNYYDYINRFRVDAFRAMVDNGDNDRYTLTAMSEHCGFSSRPSFFRSFKKVVGMTPTEYIKSRKTGK